MKHRNLAKGRKGFNPTPDPNSNRSKRRKARKFAGLQVSSRIHKRADSRMLQVTVNTHAIKQKGKIDFH